MEPTNDQTNPQASPAPEAGNDLGPIVSMADAASLDAAINNLSSDSAGVQQVGNPATLATPPAPAPAEIGETVSVGVQTVETPMAQPMTGASNALGGESMGAVASESLVATPTIGVDAFAANPVLQPSAATVGATETAMAGAGQDLGGANVGSQGGFVGQATPLVFQPTTTGLVNEMDPIAMPEPAPAPDPIEEELKAPFKAADPVPGSIGSAVSVPANGGATQSPQNVAFNDPAGMASNNQPKKKGFSLSLGGKQNKNSLIIIGVVGGIVVIILVVVLIMMLGGNI